jgi:hypothetical protein
VKAQIIHLEPFDDLVSARDKLGWVKADRVIIVWPAGARILTRRLDLVLLQRRSAEMGARVGIVSHDPEVRQHALDLNLPLFDSIDEAHTSTWPQADANGILPPSLPPRQTIDRAHIRNQRRRRLWPATLLNRMVAVQGILIASILLLATFLPHAQVELEPITYTSRDIFSLHVDPDLEAVQEGAIPATRVSLILEGSLRMPTSGQVDFPSARASGVVVFTNLGDQAINIPAGTGLRVEQEGELRFVTIEPVNLPARENSQAETAIQAAQPGANGNLPADSIRAVEGPLGLQVEVTNPEPTSGGADETRAGVAASDPPAARRLLLEDLTQQARQQMEEDLEPGLALAVSSLHVNQVLSQEYDRQAGQAADTLLVNMRVQFEAWVYAPNHLESAIHPLIEAARPDDAQAVPGTLVIEEELDAPLNWEDDRLYFQVTEEIYYGPSPEQILRLLWFIPPERAANELAQRLELERPVNLSLFPSWWPRLPILEMRIDLVYPWDTR